MTRVFRLGRLSACRSPKSEGERYRRTQQENQRNDYSPRPLKYLGIEHGAETLEFADDPRRAPLELFHFDQSLATELNIADYAPEGDAPSGMLVEAIEPCPISVASTASSSGVCGSFPSTEIKRELSIRIDSRQR
jgi:hypothetical protein